MGLLARLFGPPRNRTREAALALGLGVADVEREAPIFRDRNSVARLEVSTCPRYTLGLEREGALRWSFLQRDVLPDAPYPNGWTWRAESGSPPAPALHQALASIASEWEEEYLEFECDGEAIHAYWSEWGGAAGAEQIAGYLRHLAAAASGDDWNAHSSSRR